MKVVILILCLLLIPAFLFAQSPQESISTAAEIETLLNTKTVTYAHASRFILQAANVFTTIDTNEAFNFASERDWLPKDLSSGDQAKLSHLSLLLMNSFNIKGGLFYSLFGSPHYAYRELVYLGVIQGRHAPNMPVSGEDMLFYINRLIAILED